MMEWDYCKLKITCRIGVFMRRTTFTLDCSRSFSSYAHDAVPKQDVDMFEHFQNKDFEAVFIFYAGLTRFKCLDFTKYLPCINSYNNSIPRITKLYEDAGLILLKVILAKYNTGNFFHCMQKLECIPN